MKVLLSPTKKQVFSTPYNHLNIPVFIDKAEKLMDSLRSLDIVELKKILGTSDKLTIENFQRNQVWRSNPSNITGVSTIFAYIGEAFNYLNPKNFSDEDLKYANENLRIFSGLYGLLKPLDTIMPYRLDIKDRLQIQDVKSLYEYWTNDITNNLKEELIEDKSKLLLNLSSLEYSKSVRFNQLPVKVITPDFKTEIDGKLKTVAIWSKRMRGLMTHEVIKNRINTEEDLQKITLEGYKLVNVDNGRYLYIKQGEFI